MYVYMYMYIYTKVNIVLSCLPLHCVKYVYVYISIGKCTYSNNCEWWCAKRLRRVRHVFAFLCERTCRV